LELLIKKGADPLALCNVSAQAVTARSTVVLQAGRSALGAAAAGDQVEACQFLLNWSSEHRRPLLEQVDLVSASRSSPSSVLLQHCCSQKGLTPLLIACGQGSSKAAEFLINNKANPNAVAKVLRSYSPRSTMTHFVFQDEQSCLYLAASAGHKSVCQMLINRCPTQLLVRNGKVSCGLASARSAHLFFCRRSSCLPPLLAAMVWHLLSPFWTLLP
jgi:hypothetical protein